MNSGSPLGGNTTEITYSEFIRQAESGNVKYVTVDGEKLIVSGMDGKSYYTINPRDDQMTDRLLKSGVEVSFSKTVAFEQGSTSLSDKAKGALTKMGMSR